MRILHNNITCLHAIEKKKEFEKFPFPWLNKSGKRDASEEEGEEKRGKMTSCNGLKSAECIIENKE
jgi:hypothetical protein